MKRLFVLLVLFLSFSQLRGEGPDDQYVVIYNLIQQAEALSSSGQAGQALAKYREAQDALTKFQKGYPDWNPQVVGFRLSQLSEKIGAMSAKAPATVAAAPAVTTKPAATAIPAPAEPSKTAQQSEIENQLSMLKEQLRQAQADKASLEAKLKEALSAQPAAVDPRELAKSEQKANSLQKENELLKASLAQEKSKTIPTDSRSLQEAQPALVQAKRELSEQTERVNALTLENKVLQSKLGNLSGSGDSAGVLASAKRDLEESNRKLAEETKLASNLAIENQTLQARLKALGADVETIAALRAENALLKKQLAASNPTAPEPGKPPVPPGQAARVQAQIAVSRSDEELRRLQQIALEERMKELSERPSAGTRLPMQEKAMDADRVKQLERERDQLQKKLESAQKDLSGHRGKAAAARVLEMENQIVALRARLDVFESRQVPYTAEELALFKKPEGVLVESRVSGGKKSLRELPPGAVALVADAQRYFSSRQFDKAEETYLQVVRQDEKNSAALANLAVIQLKLNRLEEAEKHIKEAMAIDADDAFNLSILGQVKFRQEKYDEALDALSRAAKLDPQNAQIQNYLGITLGQKGMRGPAETALRKAIQLDPGYGDAHHNLAVVYLSQQPPLTELARWHYQKGLAAGLAKNAELERMLESTKTAQGGQ